jgi:hypothetical protein
MKDSRKEALMRCTLRNVGTETRHTSDRGRRCLLVCAPMMVALCLMMGDCEQEDSLSKEGSTATGTIAAGEASQTTSTA